MARDDCTTWALCGDITINSLLRRRGGEVERRERKPRSREKEQTFFSQESMLFIHVLLDGERHRRHRRRCRDRIAKVKPRRHTKIISKQINGLSYFACSISAAKSSHRFVWLHSKMTMSLSLRATIEIQTAISMRMSDGASLRWGENYIFHSHRNIMLMNSESLT